MRSIINNHIIAWFQIVSDTIYHKRCTHYETSQSTCLFDKLCPKHEGIMGDSIWPHLFKVFT